MAKLRPYFSLCPLIDHKSLLGINKDIDKGAVIVTLGKNIAVKQKISDQKQLCSWRTKEKFTSPIIYDYEDAKYVGVFNQYYIRLWTEKDDQVDKLKKFVFTNSIHTLINSNARSFIVFKNGQIMTLKNALANRKDLTYETYINEAEESIVDILTISLNDETYIGLLVDNNGKHYLLWSKFSCSTDVSQFMKINMEQEGLDLTGYCFYKDQSNAHLLSIWSDGSIFSNILNLKVEGSSSVQMMDMVLDCLDYTQPISMICIDENYVAMYGADCNEEGAAIIIYNLQFKITQSKQHLKLFTKQARLWCLEKNILLPIGQHLAVIPFELDVERLVAHTSTQRAHMKEPQVLKKQACITVNWSRDDIYSSTDHKINLGATAFAERVLTEKELMDIVEKRNIKQIANTLDQYLDIPEKWLVSFLTVLLQEESENIKNKKPSTLLNQLLSKPFNDVIIVTLLRSLLDLDSTIFLLEYLLMILLEDDNSFDSLDYCQTELKVIDWICILLDTNVMKLLATKDQKLSALLSRFQEFVKTELVVLNEIQSLSTILTSLYNGKLINKNKTSVNHIYSIEVLNLTQ